MAVLTHPPQAGAHRVNGQPRTPRGFLLEFVSGTRNHGVAPASIIAVYSDARSVCPDRPPSQTRTDRLSYLDLPRPAQQGLVYGRAPASEFLAFVGPLRGEILDIGPGEGGWSELLRDAGADRLVAIEPDPSAAEVARARYDAVFEQPIEHIGADLIADADVIIAADCLEHMIDPWAVLRQLHGASRPGTRLAVSVPNLRFLGIMAPTLLRGQFDYSEVGGLMDRGHLRWFTHASMARALLSSGWSPVRWSGSLGTGRRESINRLSGYRLTSLLSHQLYVLASRGASGT